MGRRRNYGNTQEDVPSTEDTQPLSWKQARMRLRTVLEDYIENPPPKERPETTTSRFELWFKYDMDVYAGSFLASLAFLVLSSLSLSHKGGDFFNASAPSSIYRYQVAASVITMGGCFFSAILMARRRNASAKDSDQSKRRAIIKYLAAEDNSEDRSGRAGRQPGTDPSDELISSASIHIAGTSLNDIYPVYRMSSGGSGQWVNISALLLVKGDYVALQIGDIAPANCVSLRTQRRLNESERIVEFADNDFPSAHIPSGRVTIPMNSQALLPLCNLMQIFVVEKAPIERFLRRPPSHHRSPQAHRQLHDIRKVNYFFSIAVFVLSIACISVRPGIWSSDLSVILHAPLLAAMGCLPIISPVFLMLLEVLGTARILATVHPFATGKPEAKGGFRLLLRYIVATVASRLSLHKLARFVHDAFDTSRDEDLRTHLIPIPSASMCLLEKLGVATAFCLVDDELACEATCTPQQLLIPSANGLKLLDLCPTYDHEGDEGNSDSDSDNHPSVRRRVPGRSYGSSSESSDSDADGMQPGSTIAAPIRKLNALRKRVRRRKHAIPADGIGATPSVDKKIDEYHDEVQFEDPLWWQHLPSLKCIGLACLLVDQDGAPLPASRSAEPSAIEEKLVRHISIERHRKQLQSLATCIGFETEPNAFGLKGDVTPFDEVARFHVIASRIFRERLTTDTHALGLDDARNWGKLRTDSTSVIVQDARSKAYQLTVGDPRVVTAMCHEAWQGENLTILPLSHADRQSILDISNDWNLADLDVAAFSYAPLPQTLAASLVREHRISKVKYLLDNPSKDASRDIVSEEWSMIGSQIFLGVLGSSIIPRKEIEKLLATFGEAGLRFVYFSPRNMRRTKEVASQMGIDVAWNCAISLRPLDAGESDQYRMVSPYADWSINAKLPHGIEDVRKHLKEVDNVPLLVSLFTDVTKENTMEMVETFQEYNDTVIAMGLSHLARNAGIFDTADLSVGVDVLIDYADEDKNANISHGGEAFQHDVELVTSISTSSCVFRLQGISSTAFMPEIIASGRAAFETAGSAISFVTTACAAYSLYILFAMCSAATVIPYIPAMGSVVFLLFMLPLTGLSMAMGKKDSESMREVPEKNDESLIFGKNERFRVYKIGLFKSLLPAIAPQLLWLIAFGELMIAFEPEFVRDHCDDAETWVSLIRCPDLTEYSAGPAQTSAAALAFADLMLCILLSSGSFLHRTKTVLQLAPTQRNEVWIVGMIINVAIVVVYLTLSLEPGSMEALPWYFFVLAIILPFLSLLVDESLKINNRKNIKRAVMMRRLQFETRLGMWSPK
ncbi:hypothetical protein MHU86_6336 [Fragilaria crotonensis]|nr:hypothetical protein MHU86_6336 [Fragilaria crotonensis]